MPGIADINVRIGAEIKELQRGIRSAEFRLKRFGRKAQTLGNDITRSVSLPLIGIGIAAVKTASDFEFSMTKISSQVGIAASEVTAMKDDVLKLSGDTAQAPKDLADAMFFIQSAGLRGADAMQALEFSAKAAAAGFGEASVVADLLTSGVNAYGSAVLNAEQATDVLAATVREGKASAESLSGAMGGALPIASNMGVKFHEVGAAIAAMTRTGTGADIAVTQINGIMTTFLKKVGPDMAKVLSKIGTNMNDLRQSIKEKGLLKTLLDLKGRFAENGIQAAEFFTNTRALKGFLDLTGASAEINVGIFDRMADSTGAANEAFRIAAETAEFKFKKALTELKVAGVKLGTSLLPMATKLASKISTLATSFTNLDEGTKKLIVNVAGFLIILGPAIKAIGFLGTDVGSAVIMMRKFHKWTVVMRGAMLLLGKGAVLTGTKLSGFSMAIARATVAFKALNLATKASIIGLVVTAVAAAVYAFSQWNKELSLTEQFQKTLGELNENALADTKAQRIESDLLVAILNDVNGEHDEKVRALKKLKEISPKYFGDLKLEKGHVDGLKIAYDKYTTSIINAAKAKAATAEIEKMAAAQLELKKQLLELGPIADDVNLSLQLDPDGLTDIERKARGMEPLQRQFNKTERDALTLMTQINLLDLQMNKLANQNLDALLAPSGGNLDTKKPDLDLDIGGGGGIAKGTKEIPELISSFDQLIERQQRWGELLKGVKPVATQEDTDIVTQLGEALGKIPEKIELITEAFKTAKPFWEDFKQDLKDTLLSQEGLTTIMYATSEAIQKAAKEGKQSFGELAKAAKKAAGDIIFAAIARAVITMVSGMIEKNVDKLGWFAIPLAAAAGAAVGALMSGLKSSLGFAKGTQNFAGGSALVGEAGPEIVNLPRGSQIIPNNRLVGGFGGGGMQDIHVIGKIRGDDLILVMEKAQTTKNRIR